MRCIGSFDNGEPCRYTAKLGEYCCSHDPAAQKRRQARYVRQRLGALTAAQQRGREKAALERVLVAAREIAAREPVCGSLRTALARYDEVTK